jgi:hypothetical protein
MERVEYAGYNQSKGGFNAMSGFKLFKKSIKPESDDTTNPQAVVKSENLQETDTVPINQQVVGDVTIEKGDGLDRNFRREKVKDLPNEKVGYQENTGLNAK